MITDELKQEISDFSDWCTKNQNLKHYKLVSQLFDTKKATEINIELSRTSEVNTEDIASQINNDMKDLENQLNNNFKFEHL